MLRVGGPTYIGATSLARGGMAEVALAMQRTAGGEERLVVLKRLLPHLAANKERVARFCEEVRTLAGLHHQNIVRVLGLTRDGNDLVIVLEYLRGETVRSILERMEKSRSSVPVPVACYLVAEIASGLSYLHEPRKHEGHLGVIHGDVNPSNVVACYNGRVKLIDFGVSKHGCAGGGDRTFQAADAYLAPECFDAGPVDARADVYALGVVLFELLTSHRPFEASNSAALVHSVLHAPIPNLADADPRIPRSLEALVHRSLARDPAARTVSARQMGIELRGEIAKMGATVGRPELARWVRMAMAKELAARRKIEKRVIAAGRRSPDRPASRSEGGISTGSVWSSPDRTVVAVLALVMIVLLMGAFWLGQRTSAPTREPESPTGT